LNETTIEQFWDAHPCGDHIVGGLSERFAGDYERFFTQYDAWRYDQESHILECLDALHVDGKAVLEIGLGEGSEAEQLVRRGAHYSGLDLTSSSIQRVAARFALRNLPFDDLRQGSALEIPWPDHAFDLVFSHGVLHHIPDIDTAQREIHRVLRPDGELVVMLYARRSLNYQLSIKIVRRAALAMAYPLARAGLYRPRGIVGQHVANARQTGLARYLRLHNFVHRSTDGPLNPFARVYDLDRVAADFPDFEITRSYQRYMHAPPLPVTGGPLASTLGWHLWVHLRPR
jgi:ubiquinone/menaquinone biosynthesis C-methylase UbiE